MNITNYTRKDIGNLGEKVVCEYLRRQGFEIVDQNVVRKTGEIDIIAFHSGVLHFIEVKSIKCREFPFEGSGRGSIPDAYDPSVNLHAAKIQKVVRTAEWYLLNSEWEGEWQVDGALMWLRVHDGMARVRYFPQIVQ